MAAMAASGLWSSLSKAQKRSIKRQLVATGSQAVGSVTGANRRRRRRRIRARRRAQAQPTAEQPMMAGNAISTTMKQSYAAGLSRYPIRHSEFVRDVPGSPVYRVSGYRINPANIDLFPWLATIASKFEKYTFKNLCFSIRTQTSTGTTGSVMLAIDYDPTDDAPGAKAAMLQYDGSTRSAPWANNELCADRGLALARFTAAAQSPDAATQRLNDLGTLYVACQGQQDSSDVSELWVTYDVELSVPQADQPSAQFFTAPAAWQLNSTISNFVAVTNGPAILQVESGTNQTWRVVKSGLFTVLLIVRFPATPLVTSSDIILRRNGSSFGLASGQELAGTTVFEQFGTVFMSVTGLTVGDILELDVPQVAPYATLTTNFARLTLFEVQSNITPPAPP